MSAGKRPLSQEVEELVARETGLLEDGCDDVRREVEPRVGRNRHAQVRLVVMTELNVAAGLVVDAKPRAQERAEHR